MVAQSRPRRHHGRSRRLIEELGGRRAGGGGQTSGPTGAGQQESAHHSAPHSRAGEASPGAPGAGNICDHLIVSFGKRSEDIKKKTCVLYLGVVSSLYVFRRNRWSLPHGSSVPTSPPCAGCEWRGVGRAHPPSFATPFLGMCAGSCSMYSLGRCSARTRFRRLCLPSRCLALPARSPASRWCRCCCPFARHPAPLCPVFISLSFYLGVFPRSSICM